MIRTLHHHLEIPAEHGFLVPTRIHLKKSAFPEFKAGTRPFFVGIRIRDKVVSSEPFADASSLNEIHYFMASPVSYLTIAMYDGVEKFGKWAGSVAQTVNQANDNTNDLRLNIIDEVYLQTNVSFSRVFPRAIAAVEAAFQTGIPNDALLFLGVHLGQGSPANNIPKDPIKATQLLRLAGSHHNPSTHVRCLALTQLGEMYFAGEGIEQSWEEAVKCFDLAAAEGWAQALYFAGSRYLYGQGVLKDLVKAQEMISCAADLGVAAAQKFLAQVLTENEPFQRDLPRALKYAQLLAEGDDEDWRFNCGFIAFKMEDFETARAYLQDLRHPRVGFMMGMIHLKCDHDLEKAIPFFKRGVAVGRDDCRWELDLIYFHGNEREKGCELMETAVINNYPPAEEAIINVLQTAIGSCPHCQYTMGHLYQLNKCVPQSIEEAKKYYQIDWGTHF